MYTRQVNTEKFDKFVSLLQGNYLKGSHYFHASPKNLVKKEHAFMSVIEDLYYGKIRPNNIYSEGNPKCAKLLDIVDENEKKLMAFLKAIPNTQEQQLLLTQFSDIQDEITTLNELDKFVEGFQLGAKFMLDTLILPQQNALNKDID